MSGLKGIDGPFFVSGSDCGVGRLVLPITVVCMIVVFMTVASMTVTSMAMAMAMLLVSRISFFTGSVLNMTYHEGIER